MGDSRAMGRCDVPILGYFFGLGMGIILAVSQSEGIVFVFSAAL